MNEGSAEGDVMVRKMHRYCSKCLADQSSSAKSCYRGCAGKDVRIIEEALFGNELEPCIVPSKDLCVKHPDLSRLG